MNDSNDSNGRRAPASRARRVAPVVAIAAVGGALWHSLDTSAADSLRLVARRQPPSSSGNGSGASESPATSAPAPGSTAAPGTSATSAPGNTSTVCAHPVRVDGPVIDTRWGPVQVRAELGTGNHVCSAHAIQYPNERETSVMINEQAVPWIDSEVKTQGVNFDFIGGATYTSDGYHQSLQAILDGRKASPTT